MQQHTWLVVVVSACGVINPPPHVDDPAAPDAGADVTQAGRVALPAVTSTCSVADGDPHIALSCYTCTNACSESVPATCTGSGWPQLTTSCLKADPTATETSVVYRWYESGSDSTLSHEEYLRPFVLLEYMRQLRDTAGVDPAYVPMLEDQVSYILGHSKTYVADGNGPSSLVWQSYYVRTSDGATRYYADGLNQAGYAYYFLSLAKQYGTANPAQRDRYVGLAIDADNAMERGYGNKTGGTKRVNATACGASGYTGACWYFHSRAPEGSFEPGTALNQSLYVMRTAADLLGELASSDWTNNWPADSTLDLAAWQERLRDRLANSISQWAYGTGNTATDPTAPPNLAQHMRHEGTTAPYYWADYEFDLDAHTSVEAGTHQHVCNYHTVTINDLAGLLADIDANADGAGTPGIASAQLGTGTRYQRIEKARAVIMTYTHNGGIVEGTGATGAHPLYQWFVADLTPSIRIAAEACPAAGTGGTEALYDASKTYLCRVFGAGGNAAIAAGCAQ